MLQFSDNTIIFKYMPNQHLKSTLTLKNTSKSVVYFKLKITRPKFYLVKPSKSCIQPLESLKLQITLHKDGVQQSYGDKFKCLYKQSTTPNEQLAIDLNDQNNDIQTQKLGVQVRDLPQQWKRLSDNKKSDVQTVINNMGDSRNFKSKMSLQNVVQEKNQRISQLKTQISKIRDHIQNNGLKKSQGVSKKNIIIVILAGLTMGIISSIWI